MKVPVDSTVDGYYPRVPMRIGAGKRHTSNMLWRPPCCNSQDPLLLHQAANPHAHDLCAADHCATGPNIVACTHTRNESPCSRDASRHHGDRAIHNRIGRHLVVPIVVGAVVVRGALLVGARDRIAPPSQYPMVALEPAHGFLGGRAT